MFIERKGKQPDDYPLYGESVEQFIRWHRNGYFGCTPTENDIRQWRVNTFPNIMKLPIMELKDLQPPRPFVIDLKVTSPN